MRPVVYRNIRNVAVYRKPEPWAFFPLQAALSAGDIPSRRNTLSARITSSGLCHRNAYALFFPKNKRLSCYRMRMYTMIRAFFNSGVERVLFSAKV